MIAEFDRIAADLDREIKIEQERAGIHDPAHFAYPTYAKAAMQRRENLKRSADELKAQLDDAKDALAEAFEELKKVEMLDERDHAREKAEENAREQAELDRIAGLALLDRRGRGVGFVFQAFTFGGAGDGAAFVCRRRPSASRTWSAWRCACSSPPTRCAKPRRSRVILIAAIRARPGSARR